MSWKGAIIVTAISGAGSLAGSLAIYVVSGNRGLALVGGLVGGIVALKYFGSSPALEAAAA